MGAAHEGRHAAVPSLISVARLANPFVEQIRVFTQPVPQIFERHIAAMLAPACEGYGQGIGAVDGGGVLVAGRPGRGDSRFVAILGRDAEVFRRPGKPVPLGVLVHRVGGLQRALEQISHQVVQLRHAVQCPYTRAVDPVGQPVLDRNDMPAVRREIGGGHRSRGRLAVQRRPAVEFEIGADRAEAPCPVRILILEDQLIRR